MTTSHGTWIEALLGTPLPAEGGDVTLGGQSFTVRDGILRSRVEDSPTQAQTMRMFGYKWHRRETFEGPESLARMKGRLRDTYGDVECADWWREHGDSPVVVDAGCGGAMSTIELFGERLHEVRYLGVEISEAVDVAASRFAERGLPGTFIQCSIDAIPLPPSSVDVVYSHGVLHHTDSTERALARVAGLLRDGGRVLFYVYNQKGPVREFTDDSIREQLHEVSPEEAWERLVPLTRLGIALGELGAAVDVPEAVDLLGIPAGPIDVQRLFYWYVCKTYYRPELTLDEMNHINFDWFAPANAHRQTPEQIRGWCRDLGLEIEHERVELAGVTVRARKRGPTR